jgi:hypothetical protein
VYPSESELKGMHNPRRTYRRKSGTSNNDGINRETPEREEAAFEGNDYDRKKIRKKRKEGNRSEEQQEEEVGIAGKNGNKTINGTEKSGGIDLETPEKEEDLHQEEV